VTYASLNHCASWRKDIPELRIDELEGVRLLSSFFSSFFFVFRSSVCRLGLKLENGDGAGGAQGDPEQSALLQEAHRVHLR
jgi:hypothetical protein